VGAALTIRDLTVEYSSAAYTVRALDRFSMDVSSGELVVVAGASGSGKTTLLAAVAALLTPTAGSIRLGDTEVTSLAGRGLIDYRRHHVGVVFQIFNLLPSLTAVDNVAAPLWAAGVKGRAARRRALELLDEMGLTARAHHHANDLSSGEQQRVAFARALVQDPPLLLADEPTAYLDRVQVDVVGRLLRALARPGRMVLVATHDERLVGAADRTIEM
jgi:putative ABC transport system ATP-binding protein